MLRASVAPVAARLPHAVLHRCGAHRTSRAGCAAPAVSQPVLSSPWTSPWSASDAATPRRLATMPAPTPGAAGRRAPTPVTAVTPRRGRAGKPPPPPPSPSPSATPRPVELNTLLTRCTTHAQVLDVCDAHWRAFDAVNYATAVQALAGRRSRRGPSSPPHADKRYFAFLNRLLRQLRTRPHRFRGTRHNVTAVCSIVTSLARSSTRYRRDDIAAAAADAVLPAATADLGPECVVDLAAALARVPHCHMGTVQALAAVPAAELSPHHAAAGLWALVRCGVSGLLVDATVALALACVHALPAMDAADVARTAWAVSHRVPAVAPRGCPPPDDARGAAVPVATAVAAAADELTLRLHVLADAGCPAADGPPVVVTVAPPRAQGAPPSVTRVLAGAATGAATAAGAMSGTAAATGAAAVASSAAAAGAVAAVTAGAMLAWGATSAGRSPAGDADRRRVFDPTALDVGAQDLVAVCLACCRAEVAHTALFAAVAAHVQPQLRTLPLHTLGGLVLAAGMFLQHQPPGDHGTARGLDDSAVAAFRAAHRLAVAAADHCGGVFAARGDGVPPQVLANVAVGLALAGVPAPRLYGAVVSSATAQSDRLAPQVASDLVWACAAQGVATPRFASKLWHAVAGSRRSGGGGGGVDATPGAALLTTGGLVNQVWATAMQGVYPASVPRVAGPLLRLAHSGGFAHAHAHAHAPPVPAESLPGVPFPASADAPAGGAAEPLSGRHHRMLHVAHVCAVHLSAHGTPLLDHALAAACRSEFVAAEEHRIRRLARGCLTSVCRALERLGPWVEPLHCTSTGMVADAVAQLARPLPDVAAGQAALGVAVLLHDDTLTACERQRRAELVFAAGWYPVALGVQEWLAEASDAHRVALLQARVDACRG